MRSRTRGSDMIGRFLNRAVYAEFPAMIEATNSVVLSATQSKRRAAVHAEFVQHADPPSVSRKATKF